MAFTDYFNQVQDLYIAYYQRPADPAGLIYWSQQAALAGGLTTQIINAFATSAEATANYGTITSANIGTVINAIYEALFNRAADSTGLQYYENGFNNGTFTPGTIALNILNGAQGSDLITLENKLTAANQFTQALDPALSSGSASALTATYDSADIQSAKAYLTAVTNDPTTLYTSGQTTNYIVTHIASPTDPIYINNTDYYNFTAGVDHLVGASPVNNTFEGSLSSGSVTIQAGDSAAGVSGANNTLQIYGNNTSSGFSLSSLTLTNIQNVNISGDSSGLNFSGTSGIQNLTSTAANGVTYTLNGQNVTLNSPSGTDSLTGTMGNVTVNSLSGTANLSGTMGNVTMNNTASGSGTLSGTFGNVSLNNDSGKVTYSLSSTTQTTANLAINNIGASGSGDALNLSGSSIATLNLNVSGTDYVSGLSDNASGLTTLNISGASGALLYSGNNTPTSLSGANLATLNIAGASDVGLDFASVAKLATVNAAQDAGNLFFDFSNNGANTGMASGFTFTGGTSPTTELAFTSSQLSGTTFGTITAGSNANVLGINDSGTTTISTTGALVTNINTAFAGFNTLDILTASGTSTGSSSGINASLLTHIDNYYIDNASGANQITNLTSSDTVSILKSSSSSTDTLGLSGTNQTLHVNIGMDTTYYQTSNLTVAALNTSGDYNVALNSYGSGTGSTSLNTISAWNYAGSASTTAHNITIGGNYDLTIGSGSSGFTGTFGSATQTSALTVNNTFNASSFNGTSQTSGYHLTITDSTTATSSAGTSGATTTVNNLFIAPTNTTMSLTDKTDASGSASGTGTVNVYFDVHNAAYGNLSGGLVDSFSLSGTNSHDYLLFDTNAVGLGASSSSPFGTVTTAPITATANIAQDLAQIDALGHANTLYQFVGLSGTYVVDTGASTSTTNDDIVVLIGSASAAGVTVTSASANGTAYHAVLV